jgi:benzodiazapine receptor
VPDVNARSDIVRQAATVVSYLVVMAINIAANALPLNGRMTKDISDQFPVLVIPAGYVFAIWGLIYVLLGVFTVWQALPRNRQDATLRSIGYLPALSGVFNATWLIAFHWGAWVMGEALMIALLVTLITIHLRLWARRDDLHGTRYWTIRAPWSVYLGWITVATIANTAQTLYAIGFDAWGIDPALIAAVVLATGIVIAATFVARYRDAAYGLVIVWAYAGVAVKEAGTALVAGAAVAGALIVAALVVVSILGVLRGRPGSGPSGVSAAA